MARCITDLSKLFGTVLLPIVNNGTTFENHKCNGTVIRHMPTTPYLNVRHGFHSTKSCSISALKSSLK